MRPPSKSSPRDSDVAIFRRFNRFYTRFLGVLDEGLLNTEFTLPEARVLYELAHRAAPKASVIAQELSLDPGYLSRLLKKLEQASLVSRKAATEDSRFADLALTPKGKAAFRKLDRLSQAQARHVFKALLHGQVRQLVLSMQTIENILAEPDEPKPPFVLRSHRVGDLGWAVHRESVVYAEEYGWDETFEALLTQIVSSFVMNFDPKRECCWIADVKGESVGHVFLVKHPGEPDTAKLRLLFVEPNARGMGLGRALVEECIRFARAAQYRKMVLWTQSILKPAIRIYEQAGFHLVSEEPHHSFGQDLTAQTWQLDFPSARPAVS